MDLCNQSRSAGQAAGRCPSDRPSCLSKRWIFRANFPTKFFRICHVYKHPEYYHFMPLSVALTLAGAHKVRAKQNLLASFSCTLFSLSGGNLIRWWNSSSWSSWDFFDFFLGGGGFGVFFWGGEGGCCFFVWGGGGFRSFVLFVFVSCFSHQGKLLSHWVRKKLQRWLAFGRFELIWFKLGMKVAIKLYYINILILVSMTLNWFKATWMQEIKNLFQLSPKVMNGFGMLLRLVALRNLIPV